MKQLLKNICCNNYQEFTIWRQEFTKVSLAITYIWTVV